MQAQRANFHPSNTNYDSIPLRCQLENEKTNKVLLHNNINNNNNNNEKKKEEREVHIIHIPSLHASTDSAAEQWHQAFLGAMNILFKDTSVSQ